MTEHELFEPWFARATGHSPREYQKQLALAAHPPDALHVPTGCGKTEALIGAWLFQRELGNAPRRLVYVLPMRSLVEQTAQVARRMRERLDLSEDELPIHVIMGGETPRRTGWELRPEAHQILVGTLDMLLSRALNRGYAQNRFSWPVSFGLLSADCRWVFDEVQLMGPARGTSAQLAGLRAKLGTVLPCETIWVSATLDRSMLETVDRPKLGAVMTLPEQDHVGDLRKTLDAVKTLHRIDLSDHKPAGQARAIAEAACKRHHAGTRTLVVVNRVDTAQDVYKRLIALTNGEGIAVSLLHSRFRRGDRDRHMKEVQEHPRDAGTIVVATQVIEAGIDLSSKTLVSETAPFSSIVQRLGRCNRAGEHNEDGAAFVWIDAGPVRDDAAGRKVAAPYLPADLQATREVLLRLEGRSLSPNVLAQLDDVPEAADAPAFLRRKDLLDLFDTSPDLSGMDIDIAPFIREDDERTATVFFRDLGADPPPVVDNQPSPARDEEIRVPLADIRSRARWSLDHVDGCWLRMPGGRVAPGATVMLDASEGGYDDALGWSPKSRGTVMPLPPVEGDGPEGIGSDRESEAREAQRLVVHLAEVRAEVRDLAQALGIAAEWSAPLVTAAALHDVGKAHPVFQATLRKGIDESRHADRDEQLWAKSERRGSKHARPYFRHELASALALSKVGEQLDSPVPALAIYLVAAHHGKVRLSIRPAPDEERPRDVEGQARFALGVVDGDELPAVPTPLGLVPPVALDLDCMELGSDDSWTNAVVALRDDPALGPFRLGFLEALLRVADWRASGNA